MKYKLTVSTRVTIAEVEALKDLLIKKGIGFRSISSSVSYCVRDFLGRNGFEERETSMDKDEMKRIREKVVEKLKSK